MHFNGPGDIVVRCWIACTTLTIAYLPSLSVRRIYREKAIGDASIVPLVVLQGISHVWLMYGFMTKTWFPSFPIFLISDIVALCYNFIYWRYSTDQRRVEYILGVMYCTLAMPSIYVLLGGLGYTNETRDEVAKHQGYVCGVTLCSLNLVLLKSMYDACKHKSSASMNLRSLLVGAANTCGWFTFGYVTDNWIISSPHTFVMTLHASALVVYVVFLPRQSHELGYDLDTVSIELSPRAGFVVISIKSAALDTPHVEFQALRSPIDALQTGGTAMKTVSRAA